ncbi:TPA: hypothetical protein ACK3JP_001815 [Mannheimia haemolytica]|nr:hypothetical protein [Mannheimia haemolytica]SQE32087.1 Uncharacterised protein [Mannheimia haemolytica]
MSGLGKLTVTLELENAKFQSAMTKSDYEAQNCQELYPKYG